MAFNLANGETRVLDASTGTSLPAGSVCLVTGEQPQRKPDSARR